MLGPESPDDAGADDSDSDDFIFPSTAPQTTETVPLGRRIEYVLNQSSDEDVPTFQINYNNADEPFFFQRNRSGLQNITVNPVNDSSTDGSSDATLLDVAEAENQFPITNRENSIELSHNRQYPIVSVHGSSSNSNTSSNASSRAASPILGESSHNSAQSSVLLHNNASVQPPAQVLISPMNETQGDFQVVVSKTKSSSKAKRKLSTSPPQSSAKKSAKDDENEEDEGMTCPICFESWTTSGKHRLVSLKCGHLFGQRCVERWLKDCQQKCPQCNAKAKKADVRVIYAKKLQAIDTSDLEEALRVADKAKTERRDRELELAKVRLQYTMAMEECNRLKAQMKDMTTIPNDKLEESRVDSIGGENSASLNKLYSCVKSINIHSGGGCRIMDFDCHGMNFAISQPSPHANFMSGFGVKKLSAMDLKSGYFTLLHQKAIKDLKFSPHSGNLLLSAALDGSLRITDLAGNTKVHEYKVGRPTWTCCWDSNDRNIVYTGLSTGGYVQYDLRNTSEALSTLENSTSRCPVVSLYHIPPTATNTFQCKGGLFSSTLEGAMFWQDTDNTTDIANFKPTLLPLEPGNCAGLQYCRDTHHCLVTYRPSRSHQKTTHILCEMNSPRPSEVSCNIVNNFTGGTRHSMLTRNSLFCLPREGSGTDDPQLIACLGDEVKRQLHVYNASKCTRVQSLSSDDGPPLDVMPVHMPSRSPMLAMLSKSTLKIYSLQ